jgi:hypothetical protein
LILPKLPEGLVVKPSLVWLAENRRKEQRLEVTYLTEGLSWEAQYVGVLDEEDLKMDLSGWVSLDNRSGATFRNASVKLVAGTIHRVRPPRPRGIPTSEAIRVAGRPRVEERSFFEYHLYTLPGSTTVRDREKKQVAFLEASGVPVEKLYVYRIPRFFRTTEKKPDHVQVQIRFENREASGLGIPIPRGLVRVYKRDPDGALQFVGEDRVEHTPKDEPVWLAVGEAFDVVARPTEVDRKKRDRSFEAAYRVDLANHKNENVTVQVLVDLWGDWKILESTHRYHKDSARQVRFEVPVAADGKATLDYRVRVKW